MMIAIIPARAGSKGVPNKNIRPLRGHPLIAWTISAARASAIFDRIIVSTDGTEIATVSHLYGAEVIERPAELATDDAPAKAAIRHVIETISPKGAKTSHIAYLQPTSPLRRDIDILATVALVRERGFDSAATFALAIPHPERAFRLDATGEAEPVVGHEVVWRSRQVRTPQYHLNGAVYVMATERLLSDPDPQILYGRIGAHVMPQERSVDIDTLVDFRLCEALLDELPHRTPIQIHL